MNNLIGFVIFVFAASTQLTYAEAATGAKVLYPGIYGDGRLFIALDKTINEPGCNQSRVDVVAGHKQINLWLSIALAAASAKTVNIGTSGCYKGFPTLSEDENTYLYFNGN